MDASFSQQKALGENMGYSRFTNKEELETYFLKATNATFSAGCSAYNTFINNKSISSLLSRKKI